MNESAVRFVAEIVKPWESLNAELGKPFSMNPTINDYTTRAYVLAVSIKHFPEATMHVHPDDLLPQSNSYAILSDLADSFKHGILKKSDRQCNLSVSSMFERSPESKVRFLRNRISINHSTGRKTDFMQCSLEAATFVSEKLGIRTSWSPKIFNNSGQFSDEIRVHASNKNQVTWTGMQLEIVRLDTNGEYVNVDLNGTVTFVLTSDF